LIWRCRPEATISLLIGNRDSQPGHVTVNRAEKPVATVNYRLSPRAPLGAQMWWIVLMSAVYRLPSNTLRRWLARSSPWIQAVADADFVGDIRGGDSFSDIYGFRNFSLGCLPVLSVIWIRGGIHLLPQTYGPFRSRLSEWLARYILLRAESIWCRDRVSLQEVARLTGGRRRATQTPDVAFALEAVRPAHLELDAPLPAEAGTLIGLNVSGLVYYGEATRSTMFGLRLDYQSFVQQLAEQLLLNPAHRLLLVPHTFAPEGRVESDPAACRALKARLSPELRQRVHVVTRDYDQHRIKGVIGMCDFFIGSRMHACIAALSQGVPTVGVAYSRKFAGVFETVGVEDWVIDGRTAENAQALSRIAALFERRRECRTLLNTRVVEVKSELSRAFARIVRGG
jgi:polysaccharide pyruvyl transferase WcaK-like protein